MAIKYYPGEPVGYTLQQIIKNTLSGTRDGGGNLVLDSESAAAVAAVAGTGSAKKVVLNGATAGQDSGWLPVSASPERFTWQLDSGSTSTQFTVDISADGVTSLGQAFTGVYASSTVAETSAPISFSNPQAKFFKFTVVSGGPFSVIRGA